MARPAFHGRTRKHNGLLERYSDTLGEMMLRKFTERAIRAARVEAELNSRAKSAFLSVMSHELRTPLNAIIGFSDLIRQPGAASADDASEYAEHIASAGRRLLGVVTDILDMSKLESGSMVLSRGECLLGDVLEAALDDARPLIQARKQILTVNADSSLPEIPCDHRRLRQVFTNILSNACKFTPEGGRILVLARAAGDGNITIAFADTGGGMTHEQIVMALKPFAQVQQHLSRTQEGAGLGLPLAMGIVQLHGGALHIESQPGAGTTVIVTLPTVAAAQNGGDSTMVGGNLA